MTRLTKRRAPRPDSRLLDEEVWDAPPRLTHAELFTHGGAGWRRAGFDLDDPEDVR